MPIEHAPRSKLDVVLEELRRRICLTPFDCELRLHEQTLAREFEMSRTPIRQVLQRLAYERLVETRSGVGTIAAPMLEEDRPRDLRTHHGLLRAIMEHKLDALSLREQAALNALKALAGQAAALTRDGLFDVRSGLVDVLCGHIPDPILRDAFLAGHWRVVRWHIRELAQDQRAAAQTLFALFENVGASPRESVARIIESIAAHDLQS